MKKEERIISEYKFMEEANKIRFFMTPTDVVPGVKELSRNARDLYGAMISRYHLAENRDLRDDDGYVYIVFPQDDMAACLGISTKTARQIVKELCDSGLIRKKRAGQGCCDRIYVDNVLDKESDQNSVDDKRAQKASLRDKNVSSRTHNKAITNANNSCLHNDKITVQDCMNISVETKKSY